MHPYLMFVSFVTLLLSRLIHNGLCSGFEIAEEVVSSLYFTGLTIWPVCFFSYCVLNTFLLFMSAYL